MQLCWRLNDKSVLPVAGDDPVAMAAPPYNASLSATSEMLEERKRNLLVFLRRNMAAAIAHTLWEGDEFCGLLGEEDEA